MISFVQGDLLAADADALVNTVNCVGVMGRGVALQFKKAFPDNFRAYEVACRRGEVEPGRMFVFETGQLSPRLIINFPTKRHWRGASRMEDIDSGLVALKREIISRRVRSIALPPLGTGLGGLAWPEVRARIVAALRSLEDVEVRVFEPHQGDAPIAVPRSPKVPPMTPSRAALVGLMDRYLRGLMEPNITLLEVHKLCYFLQAAGQGLRLKFVKGHYGPYAENLRFVLSEMEGYYTAGFRDGGDQPTKPISLVPGALEAADGLLAADFELQHRFDRVVDLVEGFETSLGLELLATTYWVATEEHAATTEAAAQAFQAWNTRKAGFTPRQIGIALDRLREKGWLADAAA
jgi:O-acetyl-ADP-ribose deacetylase (regulator of RNase III)